MNRLNALFSLSSLSVLLVTIERFSPTTKILLQPYNFLRLHELIQMTFLILFTVIIPFLLLKEVSSNFKTLQMKKGLLFVLLFTIGVYFYSTGNGIHETAGFYLNQYCNPHHLTSILCKSFFFNDYYTGNIFYFVGGILMLVPLLLLEKSNPNGEFKKKDMTLLLINAFLYAFAIFAYAAFDTVLVGLIYSLIMTIISGGIYLAVRKSYLKYPLITYTAVTYTLGTIAAVIVRITS